MQRIAVDGEERRPMEMRTAALRTLLLLVLAVTATGCEAIGTIFEAGLWVGAIVVLLILGVIGLVVSKLRRP